MSFRSMLHSDRGEQFWLLHGRGPARGSRLLGLLMAIDPYHTYMMDKSKFVEQAARFSQWAGKARDQIIATTGVLNQSWYGGNYSPSECDWILKVIDDPEQREEWKQRYEAIRERWVDVDGMLTDVRGLLKILAKAELEPNEWYDRDDVNIDLQALLETILLAKSRGASKVIIQIM